jgi:hypothetical protein
MLSLAGALTTFSPEGDARSLPAYDHTGLSTCFHDLDERLRTLLETVVPQNYRAVPLRPVKPFVYAAAMDSSILSARQIFLAVGAGADRATLVDKALELLKVGAAENLDHLYRRGLPGLELTHVLSPPSAIPVKLDYEYFLIDTSGPEWAEVLRSKNLAVYVPAAIREPSLELVAVLPRRSRPGAVARADPTPGAGAKAGPGTLWGSGCDEPNGLSSVTSQEEEEDDTPRHQDDQDDHADQDHDVPGSKSSLPTLPSGGMGRRGCPGRLTALPGCFGGPQG